MTFGLDLGYFDETIWKISQGKFPYSGVGCIWLLEDHFQPILYLFGPLYRIWPDVKVLLIVQSLLMVLAAYPLYLTGKKISRNNFFSFAVCFAYLFFIGTQFSILNEFHQTTLAPFFIAWSFYFLTKKNFRLFLFYILILFFIKEDLSLLVASVGMALFINSKNKRMGIFLTISGISFFFLLLYVIMPKISIMGRYSHLDFGAVGQTPIDIVFNIFKNPMKVITIFIDSPLKLHTLFISFYNFSFLPIFSGPFYLIILFEDLLTRFIYYGPQITKWSLVNHHAVISAIILPLASIYGARFIYSKLKKKLSFNLIGSLLIFTTVTQMVIVHAPVFSILKKDFYMTAPWMLDNRAILAKVPDNASVASQNSLLPHLTHRDSIYRIPFGSNSQYMVFDLHDGPNKYAPLNHQEMIDFVNNLLSTKRYSIVYQKGEAILLKRNYKTDITKSKYWGDTRYCYYSFEER